MLAANYRVTKLKEVNYLNITDLNFYSGENSIFKNLDLVYTMVYYQFKSVGNIILRM